MWGTIATWITAALVATAALTAAIFYMGWGVWILWGWYAVPAGAPALGYLEVCGLLVMVKLIMVQTPIEQANEQRILAAVVWAATMPVSVSVGWVLLKLGGG